MRGDQLARQCRNIWEIEASPNGLTETEIAQREETGIRTIYRDLEALQSAGLPLLTEKVERAIRWTFIDTFKIKGWGVKPELLTRRFLFCIFEFRGNNTDYF
jgi:predicted DNA-binding transcriptional regulator YafY